jgi:RNA polymerase sigma-70 factor, ECF subfamily
MRMWTRTEAPHAEPYLRYGPALTRKARRILRNETDAVDAVQNLFVELLAEPGRPLDLPYLYRMLTHRCLNLLRDERNRARLIARESEGLAPQSRVAPDLGVLTLDVVVKLGRAVDEVVLETFVYRYFDDMGLEEIATLLSVSRKTVQNRLARADAALAALAQSRLHEVSP